jgi:hypothetical protein
MQIFVFLAKNWPRENARNAKKRSCVSAFFAFWLDPVRLEQSGGFRSHEINRIQQLIQKNQRLLLESWNEYFND